MDNALARLLFASPLGLLLYIAFGVVMVLVIKNIKSDPQDFRGKETEANLIFGGFGMVLGCFLWCFTRWTAYATQGKLTMCPKCRQWFSAVEITSDTFNSGRVKAKVYSPKAIRNAPSGMPIGYIDDYEDVDAIRITKLTHWQCKRCGHKWMTDEHARVPV
jgi:hypothetical protein